jgi:hypothetical protein
MDNHFFNGFMDELLKVAQKVKPFMKSVTTETPGGGSKTEYAPKQTKTPSGRPMTVKSTVTRPGQTVGQYAKGVGYKR